MTDSLNNSILNSSGANLNGNRGYSEDTPKKNFSPTKGFLCFKKKVQWSEMPDREIYSNMQDMDLCNNQISTSKYTLLSFIPKNLYVQFSKLANVYFLFIGIMQAIKIISISKGNPVIFLPLSFILFISAMKDVFEDLKRHRSDKEENTRRVLVGRNGRFESIEWQDLRVGEIVKLNQNEYFPADMLILQTSEPKGVCFIETKNLDGETNLKHKLANKDVAKIFENEAKILQERVKFYYEKPNPYLYTFTGTIEANNEKIPLDSQNFVLRGSSIRNTKFIYGLIAYTGHDTKIMLNSVKARSKQSKLERQMNHQILIVFVFQLILCFFSAIYYSAWYQKNKDDYPYLEIDYSQSTDHSFAYNLFVRFGNWILIFTNFVPISLLVTLETVKFIQAMVISKDENIKEKTSGQYTTVQSSNLNEELGQVEYIFSDKTGTLTCNEMEYKMLSVEGRSFGEDSSKDVRNFPKVTNVDFKDKNFYDILDNVHHALNPSVCEFLLTLALCHSVIVENKDNKIIYNASSPDELALVNFAKFSGYEYIGLDESNNLLVRIGDSFKKFQLLYTLEFTSARKRMSVVLRDYKNDIILITKGADSILLERMNKSNDKIDPTWKNLERYAEQGLRTLLITKKVLNKSIYDSWARRYQEATVSMNDREKKMTDLQEELEVGLELVGATAIEDKLQDEVGLTIATLKQAGIKVWVLTGDKIETAINIGYSCKLLTNDLIKIIIDSKKPEEILNTIRLEESGMSKNNKYALIVSGDALIQALNQEISPKLMRLASKCDAVLCCRVSPKQKQEVVSLVRHERPHVTTLAIGDGANDVNMITAAHVGVGIRGVEGQQAARASDYAIGQFKFLKRLLLFHGREAYRRNTNLICYNFFKNVLLVLPQFWYGFFNFFSGQTLYDSFLYQLFNMLYASVPIVVYAIFDKEYEASFLEVSPMYYIQGMQSKLFNTRVFWKWFFFGSWQALLIAIISYQSLNTSFTNPDGFSNEFWGAGIMAFGGCVVVANLKVAMFSNSFSPFFLITIFGSILVYIISFAIVNGLSSSELYSQFSELHKTSNFFLGYILMIIMTCGLDYGFNKYEFFRDNLVTETTKTNAKVYNDSTQVKYLNNHIQGQGGDADDLSLMRRASKKHTGFAFSHEDVNDYESLKNYRM